MLENRLLVEFVILSVLDQQKHEKRNTS